MSGDDHGPDVHWWEGPTRCDICGWSGRSVIPIPRAQREPLVPMQCGGCMNWTLRPDFGREAGG